MTESVSTRPAFYRLPDLCRELGGIHRATIYRLVQAGKLPPPVKIGRASVWPAAIVDKIAAGALAA